MQYLTAREILLLHHAVVSETGGSHGVRESGVIESAVQLPQQTAFGKELYTTPFEKSAIYIRTIVMNHPFIDGNKRTGTLCGMVFLENNGYKITTTQGGIELFALSVVEKKLEIPEIAEWLKRNSQSPEA